MKISSTMVKALLGYVTSGWYEDHAEPPQGPDDVADAVRSMRAVAQASGDLPWLKIALGYLLTDGEAEISMISPSLRMMPEEEVRDLLFLTWEGLFPGEPPPAPGQGPAVEFAPMTAEDWLEYRKAVYGG